MPAPIDLLVVGNCCHDTLIAKDGREHRVPGGSAAYISAVLQSIGARFHTVSKVGADFRYLDALPFAPLVEGPLSCAFIDDYRSGERRETLEAAGPRILPADLAGLGRARIAIACAVAGEVLPETLLALRAQCDLLLADAQGLVRAFGPGGEVRVQPLALTPFAPVLGALDWLKVGAGEQACVDPATCDANLLFTDGPRGCLLEQRADASGKRERRHVAPFPAEERDATGAGDCFLAGFAFGLLRGLTPERAARLGNCCGARAVESVGIPRLEPSQLAALLEEDPR